MFWFCFSNSYSLEGRFEDDEEGLIRRQIVQNRCQLVPSNAATRCTQLLPEGCEDDMEIEEQDLRRQKRMKGRMTVKFFVRNWSDLDKANMLLNPLSRSVKKKTGFSVYSQKLYVIYECK